MPQIAPPIADAATWRLKRCSGHRRCRELCPRSSSRPNLGSRTASPAAGLPQVTTPTSGLPQLGVANGFIGRRDAAGHDPGSGRAPSWGRERHPQPRACRRSRPRLRACPILGSRTASSAAGLPQVMTPSPGVPHLGVANGIPSRGPAAGRDPVSGRAPSWGRERHPQPRACRRSRPRLRARPILGSRTASPAAGMPQVTTPSPDAPQLGVANGFFSPRDAAVSDPETTPRPEASSAPATAARVSRRPPGRRRADRWGRSVRRRRHRCAEHGRWRCPGGRSRARRRCRARSRRS